MTNTINIQLTKQPSICPDSVAKSRNSYTPLKSSIFTFSAKAKFESEEARTRYELEHGMQHHLGHVRWTNLLINTDTLSANEARKLRKFEDTDISIKCENPFDELEVEEKAHEALINCADFYDIFFNGVFKKSIATQLISFAKDCASGTKVVNHKSLDAKCDGATLIFQYIKSILENKGFKISYKSLDSSEFTFSFSNNNTPLDLNIIPITLPKNQSIFDFFIGVNTFNVFDDIGKPLHTTAELMFLMVNQIHETMKLTIDNYGSQSTVNTAKYMNKIKRICQNFKKTNTKFTTH
mgnify:CR=1 FL=1